MKNVRFLIAAVTLAFAGMLFPLHPMAQTIPSEDSKKSLEAQADRAGVVYERGKRAHYTEKFDLSGLPHYKPGKQLTGWVRIGGSNYLADGMLGEYWEQGFAKYQPDIKLSYYVPTSAAAFGALDYDQADLVMDHKPDFYDLLAYERIKGFDPLEITALTGSYDVAGWQNSLVILVNKDNPLKGISLKQIDDVFGAARDGGWSGTNFHPEWARGADQNIRTWGQLGLKGAWADKPIHVYGFNMRYSTATEFSDRFLRASDKWNENLHGYAHIVEPNGKRYIEADQITDALARDPYGIAYNRFRGDRPAVRILPVAAEEGGPYVAHTLENTQNRTYPLFSEAYFYASVKPGTALNPLVKEFLRYVLSQEGQAEVERDGKYLPLTADVVRAQLKKLSE